MTDDDYTFAEPAEMCFDCGNEDTDCNCTCEDCESPIDDCICQEQQLPDEHCGDSTCLMCNGAFGSIVQCDEKPVNDQ